MTLENDIATLGGKAGSGFHFFPLLPIELRLAIWNLAVDQTPRTFTIRCIPALDPGSDNECSWSQNESDGPPITPPLLQTCREARNNLTMYSKEFVSSSERDMHCWVNFAIDTIQLEYEVLDSKMDFSARRVQHMQIEIEDPEHFFEFGFIQLQSFKSLQSLRILSYEEPLETWGMLMHGKEGEWICPPSKVTVVEHASWGDGEGERGEYTMPGCIALWLASRRSHESEVSEDSDSG